jgi:hypothetical protein
MICRSQSLKATNPWTGQRISNVRCGLIGRQPQIQQFIPWANKKQSIGFGLLPSFDGRMRHPQIAGRRVEAGLAKQSGVVGSCLKADIVASGFLSDEAGR